MIRWENHSYLLQCQVGLFYITEEWAKEKLEFLAQRIPEEEIERRTKNSIVLKNGSSIKAVPANGNIRGSKFNRILYQEGIDKEVLDAVIRPMICSPIVAWR